MAPSVTVFLWMIWFQRFFSVHLNPECLTRFVLVSRPQLWSKWNDWDIKAKHTHMAASVYVCSHWVSKARIQGGQTSYQMEWCCTWMKPLFQFITSLSFTFRLCHKMQRLIECALTNSQWSVRQCEACRCVCVCKVSVCIKRLVFPLSWQRKLSSETVRLQHAAACQLCGRQHIQACSGAHGVCRFHMLIHVDKCTQQLDLCSHHINSSIIMSVWQYQIWYWIILYALARNQHSHLQYKLFSKDLNNNNWINIFYKCWIYISYIEYIVYKSKHK